MPNEINALDNYRFKRLVASKENGGYAGIAMLSKEKPIKVIEYLIVFLKRALFAFRLKSALEMRNMTSMDDLFRPNSKSSFLSAFMCQIAAGVS
jgi:hypothetical protein